MFVSLFCYDNLQWIDFGLGFIWKFSIALQFAAVVLQET